MPKRPWPLELCISSHISRISHIYSNIPTYCITKKTESPARAATAGTIRGYFTSWNLRHAFCATIILWRTILYVLPNNYLWRQEVCLFILLINYLWRQEVCRKVRRGKTTSNLEFCTTASWCFWRGDLSVICWLESGIWHVGIDANSALLGEDI